MPDPVSPSEPLPGDALRRRMHQIIFGTQTPAGRGFDLVLLVCILFSVVVVMLDTVESIHRRHAVTLLRLEWGLTMLFTLEYAARLYSVPNRLKYATSFFGIVDFVSIIPTYLSVLIPGANYLLIVRVARLLRIFRVLKLVRYLGEADQLLRAMRASRVKITVFLGGVFTLVIVMGTLMYLVEGSESGFTSIPVGVYWAIVTLTTVGYGDITPHTVFGQFLSSIMMITGYAIIAVPTGIITSELHQVVHHRKKHLVRCAGCNLREHDDDAIFCKHCGGPL